MRGLSWRYDKTAQTLRIYVNIIATFAVINAAVNVVLPGYVQATFAPFVDFRTVGYADVVNLKIPPKTLYTVSKGNKIAA